MYSEDAVRKVWIDGFCPGFPTIGLIALVEALDKDDDRLTQGSTTTPPPLMCVQDWSCEGACATGFIGAVNLGGFADARATGKVTNPHAATVGQVEEFFARACFDADQRLGEVAGCRHFLNWHDDTPRDEMRAKLASWTREAISDRPADYDSRHPRVATDIQPTAVVQYNPFQ